GAVGNQVVAVGENQVLASGASRTEVASGSPTGSFIRNNPDPRVARRILASEVVGAVGRGVVDDDDLEVFALAQHRIEGLPQPRAHVVRGDDDRICGVTRSI